MSKSLFNQFPDVSSKEWKQKIQADLKGVDYNKTLIWQTNEGIDVKPFYHKDEFNTLPEVSASEVTKFKICQTIFVANVAKSNTKALDIATRGAEAIKFIIPTEDISIKELLQHIDLSNINLYFELQFLSPEYVKRINSYKQQNSSIYVNTDIIGKLSASGNWFSNLKDDHKYFDSIISSTKTLSINVSHYQNAGANITQQLGYALAHANEYLNHFDNTLDNNSKEQLNVIFNVSIGTNYFFEIAKLRALRILWKSLASQYGVNTECHIFATPSIRNKTIYDYNTNLLRTTTECMSAILGGANTVNNLAYDAVYHKDNEFSERIARNQLLILKHESYFNAVNNPADGAYYIESLTAQISEKALDLFKDIEANGGFLNQLKEGTIQRKIKESAAKEQKQFDEGELVLLGTNKHPNKEDIMHSEIELYPFLKTNPVKTLVEPIINKRLSNALDENRLNKEKL
ncbi:methylmalonyl-CoA mutase subunit beta [Psychroserpens ponticola]|uniref:Methylmalonyl-CoA mutase subunit beta n=1 Tax=Psychroserpens ponticola TaxID=2932268 RepID=A0ABY7S0Z0_9FLAO|nr:methylmalonyl-CoA mutase subunit beta [Psychroserpens ponticola]WCO02586.1 methylmalonyl-CoA mutase subunit beta [Psychroserpens ponticola]